MTPAAEVAGSARSAAIEVAPAIPSSGERSSTKRQQHRFVARTCALLPSLAFAIAGVTLAAYQPADAAVETRYLTLVGGCTLAGATLFAGVGSRAQAIAPVLAMLALWAMPAGPPRGIAFGVVLVAAFVLAGWRRLGRRELDIAAAVGGALALHTLLRASELLPALLVVSSAASIARLVVPPVLAGLALAWLARARGVGVAVVGGAATGLAAQGFTVTGALPLLAIAGAAALRAWHSGRTTEHQRPRRLSDAVRNMDAVAAVGFGLAVAALGVVRPAAAALALAAAALIGLPRVWVWLVALAPLVYALATHADPQRLFPMASLVVLMPFAFTPGAMPPLRLVGAVLVGAAGALLLPTPAGLAAAVAALAFAMSESSARVSLQRGWLGALLAVTALAAGYPWLRSSPLDAALAVLGSPAVSTGRAALLVAVALLAAAAVLWVVATRVSVRVAAVMLALVIATAAIVAMPKPMRSTSPAEGIALRGDVREWSTALRAGSVSRVRVLSSLADAAALPAGTAVATLSLERDGRPLAAWTLRAGKDIAEWAAERPDLRGVAAAGPIWWSSLPPRGTFFAHAYVSTWQLSRPVAATGIRVVRDPALPPEVTLSLLRVEVNE